MAWLTWNHPNMPWDGTELWLAPVLPNGLLGEARLIAGGWEESIFQPSLSPDGTLYFVSDRTGGWNLYRWRHETVEAVYPKAAEFGMPQWLFGMSAYGFDSAGNIWCIVNERNICQLAEINVQTGTLLPISLPYSVLSNLHVHDDMVAFLAGSPAAPTVIALYDTRSRRLEILRHTSQDQLDPSYLSLPEPSSSPPPAKRQHTGFITPPRTKSLLALKMNDHR